MTTITREGIKETPTPWVLAPADDHADNTLTLNPPTGQIVRETNANPTQNSSCECRIDATIKMTAKWTHEDPNTQNDTNDPPPTSVWVVETSAASWGGVETGVTGGGGGTNAASRPGGGARPADAAPPVLYTYSGSSNDGIGDPEVKTPVSGPPYTGSNSTSPPPPTPPLPPGWHKCAVAKDFITLPGTTRTLLADGTATGKKPGQVGVMCGLGPYNISIHAQPYNFHQLGPGTDNGDGTLSFTYSWLSTSGDVSGLKSCVIYEHVVYPGAHGTPSNPVPYQPPSPPYNTDWSSANNPNGMKDPTELPNPKYPAQNIGPGYVFGDDNLIVGSFRLPPDNLTSVNSPFTATQTFMFDDSATGDSETQIPGGSSGGSGPFSITRNITNNTTPPPPYATPYGYVYTISKNGITAQKVITP